MVAITFPESLLDSLRASRLRNYPVVRLSWPKPFRPRYPSLSIQASNIIYDGKRSTVYEGNYVGKMEDLKLAIKISDYPKMLAVEAQRYTSMRALQGTVIPRLHGWYLGKLKTGKQIGLLATELWGEQLSLEEPFDTMARVEQ